MPFQTLEKSTHRGQPVQLYEFLRTSDGTNFYWRYNTSDRDLSYGGFTYTAVPISGSQIRLSGEAVATDFTVTLPITEDFCQTFRFEGTVPSDSVFLRVRRVHAADISDIDGDLPIVADQARIVWVGTVNGITQVDEITAKITCAMLAASFRRGGLRYGYQRSCPHVLYAPLTCRLNREDFRVNGVVTAVAGGATGTDVHAAEFASQVDGWYVGGFLEYILPNGMTERRMIANHLSTTIGLLGFAPGILVGDTVAAFAGCDRIVSTCQTKFNNLANMGGFPHTPGRSPYDGAPVF